jgi:hypothetical protein
VVQSRPRQRLHSLRFSADFLSPTDTCLDVSIVGERGVVTRSGNGTQVNFESTRSSKQLYIALQCSGRFQNSVPVVD